MDKLIGTVVPVSTDKKIASIQVKVLVGTEEVFKVSDIQFQEGEATSQYGKHVSEHIEDEKSETYFNFLARGTTTVIVPYMSEVPYNSGGLTLPCETDYVTTPIRTELLIHKPFATSNESLYFGSGLSYTAKRFELNSNVGGYTECVYDGYTSRQYIGGVEKHNVFVGQNLRLANGDCKYTLGQNKKRKSTGVLYANKTRREV